MWQLRVLMDQLQCYHLLEMYLKNVLLVISCKDLTKHVRIPAVYYSVSLCSYFGTFLDAFIDIKSQHFS